MSDDDSDPLSPLILYATETGTSEDSANKIARQCRRIYMSCRVLNLDSYSLASHKLSDLTTSLFTLDFLSPI